MKNRILTFIIGVLTGAIITTTGFLMYNKVINNNTKQYERNPINQNGQMQPPNENLEEPPTKPEEKIQSNN